MKVLYGGTELFDNEVRHTFHNDMMLAVISGACITLLVFVLTSFSGRTCASFVLAASFALIFVQRLELSKC